MKKSLSMLLVVLMVIAMIPTALSEDVTITFATWDTNQEPGMTAIANAYMEKNPGVKVEVQVTPWNEYWTKLEAAAQGGALPDAFWMHSNQFMKYASADVLLDLTDLDYDYSHYPEGITGLYTFNEKHLAIPKDYDTIALAYNKEIFDNAGVAYPDDTWDWAKFREVAIQLTDKDNGIYGFCADNDTQSGYYNLVHQNGGFIFKDGVSGFDQPKTQEAIKWWSDLLLVDGVSPTPEALVDLDRDGHFQAGKLAMVFVGSWMMSAYTSNELIAGKFDLTVLPKGAERASIYNGLGYAGAATTKNPEQVKDFLAFCGSQEANELQGKAKAAIPAYAGTEHFFVENFENLNIGCYPEMIEYGVQFPYGPNKSLWEGIETETMTAVFSGEMSVEDACMSLHEQIMEIEADN